jgi:transposase-like protein
VGRARQPHDDHALGLSVLPEYERRWNRRAKPVGTSWRVDETYIRTRPKTGYLYRAVDKEGKTVDSLFHPGRGITAAMDFFRKAAACCAPRWPRKITLDGHKPSHLGLRRLRREDHRWKYVLVRTSPYLNNVIEQDHRAIKSRCRPMMGFKSYRTAAVTLAGLELAHRIRKPPVQVWTGSVGFLVVEETVGYGACLKIDSRNLRYPKLVPLTHHIAHLPPAGTGKSGARGLGTRAWKIRELRCLART